MSVGTRAGRGARGAAVALLAALGAARPASAAPPGPVGPVSGGSFPHRHEEYRALVANGSDRALAMLVAAYRRRDVSPTERGCIVSLACDGFEGTDLTAPLRAWREKNDDAWLWYRTLRREIGAAGGDGAYAVSRDPKRRPLLRAAAVRALAAWAEPGLPEFVAEAAKGDLGKEPGRSVLLDAIGEALASQPGRLGAPALRTAFEALLPFLRKEAAEPRTRLSLARAFARLLDAPRAPADPAFYEALLDRLAAPQNPEDDRYATPHFFGVEGTGDRVVYVVDESGSMNEGLTEAERQDLRRAAAAKRTGDGPDPMSSLPWEQIRTRRDAAVEFTKASIRALPESAWFAVILFDDSVTWLGGGQDLVPATKPRVEAVMKALDRARLGGGTNLHGGLRRAFETLLPSPRPRSAGPGALSEEVPRAPTTVFLLTDGVPNYDDWGFSGRGPGGKSPAAPGAADALPTAPYEETESIAGDVERLNLFLGCEIHAIGIGEANPDLLDRLAFLGRGRVRRVGEAPNFGRLAAGVGLGGGIGGAAGSAPGHLARDAVALLERMHMAVPEFLRKMAEDEAKAEREKGGPAAPPPAPGASPPPDRAPPAGAPTPEADRATLRNASTAGERAEAATRLGSAGYGLAVPDLARALLEDRDVDVQRAAAEALAAIAGRHLAWRPGLPAHARAALRRNWGWWWDLHRADIEKAAADKAAAGKAAAPPK